MTEELIDGLFFIITVTHAKQLLRYLGLVEVESAEKVLVLNQVRRQMRTKMHNSLEHLAMVSGLTDDSIEYLKSTCSVFTEPERLSVSEMFFDPAARSGLSNLQDIQCAHLHERLLVHIRIIFYEIVRAQYWGHITAGKIPRESYSSKVLLYSIDIALNNCKNDSLKTKGCSGDWFYIEEVIHSNEKLFLSIMAFLDRITPQFCNYFRYLSGWSLSRKTKRAVYLLTCFIDAHERAKAMIHSFISDSAENTARLPEEESIVAESVEAVSRAKQLLAEINADQMRGIVEKQAARFILEKQTEFVNEMLQKGMLTCSDAQLFFKEISRDVKRIEKARLEMDRRQSRMTADLFRSSNQSATSASFKNFPNDSLLANLLPKR